MNFIRGISSYYILSIMNIRIKLLTPAIYDKTSSVKPRIIWASPRVWDHLSQFNKIHLEEAKTTVGLQTVRQQTNTRVSTAPALGFQKGSGRLGIKHGYHNWIFNNYSFMECGPWPLIVCTTTHYNSFIRQPALEDNLL